MDSESQDDDPLGKMAGAVLVEHAIGRVVGVYLPGEYVSPVNNHPVMGHVVVLDNGHSFTFDADAPATVAQAKFHELTQNEMKFTLALANAVNAAVVGSARLAGAMRVPLLMATRITVALLKTAQYQLQGAVTHPQATPVTPG